MKLWTLLLLGLSTLHLAGCSGDATQRQGTPGDVGDAGSGSGSGSGSSSGSGSGSPGQDAGGDGGWGASADIASILNDDCSTCHGTAWAASCWTAEASASSIESAVSSGYMPPGGMSASDKSALLSWLSNPSCSGTAPDGGGPVMGMLAGEIVTTP